MEKADDMRYLAQAAELIRRRRFSRANAPQPLSLRFHGVGSRLRTCVARVGSSAQAMQFTRFSAGMVMN